MATLEGDAEECLLVVGKGRREMSLRGIRRKTGRSTGRQDVMICIFYQIGEQLPHSVGITGKKRCIRTPMFISKALRITK